MTERLLTTVVGSYPQPEWLIDRKNLQNRLPPRVRAHEIWRIPEPLLQQAQDDATLLAIRDMERAGIDILSDGEIRRESYSNRFATALGGMDLVTPGVALDRTGHPNPVPRVVGPIHRLYPVEVRDVEFLRRNTTHRIKITVPGPFTVTQQAQNDYYSDEKALAMDIAAAINEEIKSLQAAGADIVHNRPPQYSFLTELSECVVKQISIEAAQPNLDLSVLRQLANKTIIVGVLNLGDMEVETPETVAGRIRSALQYVEPERLILAPDCGMKYLPREVAFGKLRALVDGARIVRQEL